MLAIHLEGTAQVVIVDFLNGLEVDDTFELGLFLVWWRKGRERASER